MRSGKGKKDRAKGKADGIGGRILEMFGKLTGNKKANAYGKGARTRGKFRTAKGRARG